MLFFHLVLTAFMVGVVVYDMTRYIIPNWVCGVLLALYPAMLLMAPELPQDYSILWSVGVALLVFVVGIGIFAMNWAGGGDIKLLTVLSLWAGREAVPELVILTGLLGGLLALALVVLLRPAVARFTPMEKVASIPRMFRHNEPLPYGVAIAFAFGFLLWQGEIPVLGAPF